VRHLAQNLSKEFHTCILSRGYKRKSKGTLLVSYKGDIKTHWEEAGDEPYMLAEVLRDVSGVVDEQRCRGGLFATKELKAEVVILDDGFQHRRIYRDIDLLLIKEKDLKDHLLPFGRLREPLTSLKRASAVILSYQDVKEWDIKVDKPTFKLYRKDWKVVNSLGYAVENFQEMEFIAFAGLGDNEQFFKTLEKLGIKVVKRLSFRDHHDYRDFKLLRDKLYITTLKDAVKLPQAENLYYLDYSIEVEGLLEFVLKALGGLTTAPEGV